MKPGISRRGGFTIVEVIVIIVIIGVIAAVIAPQLLSRIGQSKQALAASNAASLASQMTLFCMDHGKPEAGATISILYERPSNVPQASWKPYVSSAKALLDPWGRSYILVMPGTTNIDFDIVSYGADGRPGGTDEDADIIKP